MATEIESLATPNRPIVMTVLNMGDGEVIHSSKGGQQVPIKYTSYKIDVPKSQLGSSLRLCEEGKAAFEGLFGIKLPGFGIEATFTFTSPALCSGQDIVSLRVGGGGVPDGEG